uniref:Uncharacterized protein n=1 Tax=Syphacia muris TaxID=451379 RepID=A0A0N5AFT2_9BILA
MASEKANSSSSSSSSSRRSARKQRTTDSAVAAAIFSAPPKMPFGTYAFVPKRFGVAPLRSEWNRTERSQNRTVRFGLEVAGHRARFCFRFASFFPPPHPSRRP